MTKNRGLLGARWSLIAASLFLCIAVQPATALPWSKLRLGLKRGAATASVSPPPSQLISLFSGKPKQGNLEQSFGVVFRQVGETAQKKGWAKLDVAGGKLTVTKPFQLAGVEVDIGTINLRRAAVLAGASYATCANGRAVEEMSEPTFDRCLRGAIDAIDGVAQAVRKAF